MGRIIKAPTGPAPAAPPVDEGLRVDAAALFEAARRDGFAAGHADGTAQAALQAALILAEARAEAARALAAVTPTAIALAAKMAERVVGRAVAADESVLAEIAAEALGTCRTDVAWLRIRVHPAQLAAIEQRRDRLAARAPGVAIDLVADEGVSAHGCVIDTPRGRVDARLETQLAALQRALSGLEGAHG
ncbi:MAG: FliH/SctL family protein [Pseudomonadota bacterium]